MIGQPPPFALDTPSFRFRAIATYAGRAPLGGDRELALASLVSCRLASGLLKPFVLAPADLKSRGISARQWLSSLSISPAIRSSAAAVIDACADGDIALAAKALANMVPQVSGKLDEQSIAEVRDLILEMNGGN